MGLWERTAIFDCSWHFQLLEQNYRKQSISSEIRQLVLSQIIPNYSLVFRENKFGNVGKGKVSGALALLLSADFTLETKVMI
jgi:hypothetical protein